MSLGGGASTALDDAVRSSIAAGVTYAIAAGNSNANACDSSPARVAQALTVGSSTNADARSSFSNFGTCVDLFAPGSGITSAWNTSNTATEHDQRHVDGLAARGRRRGALPRGEPVGVAERGACRGGQQRQRQQADRAGTGSPNRLLYSLFGAAPPTDAPPTATFTYTCSGLTCTFDGSGSTDDVGITSYSWNFGDWQSGSGAVVSHTYGSQRHVHCGSDGH